MSTQSPTIAIPRTVTVSFWLYIVAAIINAVAGLLGLLALNRVDEAVSRAQQQNPNANISSGMLQGIGVAGVVIAVVIAIIWSVLVIAFAVQMRKGRNWARIVLLVLGILSVFGAASAFGLGAVVLVLSIVAIVFSFVRSSGEYFRNGAIRGDI